VSPSRDSNWATVDESHHAAVALAVEPAVLLSDRVPFATADDVSDQAAELTTFVIPVYAAVGGAIGSSKLAAVGVSD
jgi:hypothetical protein